MKGLYHALDTFPNVQRVQIVRLGRGNKDIFVAIDEGAQSLFQRLKQSDTCGSMEN